MLNVVVLMGRLVADPQLRQTTTGKNVASFRVACDRGRRDANGQNQADFFDVVAWDRSAEFVCRYFQKGSMIAIDGRLQSRNYQDKSGNNRTAIEIVASNINFVTPKSQNPAAGMGAPMASAPIPAAPADYSRPAAQPAAPAYSAGSNDDFALIEDEGDLPSLLHLQSIWLQSTLKCFAGAEVILPSIPPSPSRISCFRDQPAQ